MLSGDLKKAALSAAEIFVLPSYSEGFSIAVLEAMAAGLPCVITTGCNFPEAAQAEAAIVTPPEVEPFSSAVATLLGDPAGAARMGNRARKLVAEHYTWDTIAGKVEERLRLLGRRT